MVVQGGIWLELEARVLLAKSRVLSEAWCLTLAIEIAHALGALAARQCGASSPSPLLAGDAELLSAWVGGLRSGAVITIERKNLCEIVMAMLRLDTAIAAADVDELCDVLDHIGNIVAGHDDASLPIIGTRPDLAAVVVAGRKCRDGEIAYRKEVEKSRVRRAERQVKYEAWLTSLPSAEELMEIAKKSADPFHFHGYDLWREGDGWSLTNAYGCDNCAYLSSLRNFEWLLSTIKAGKEIGPVPPGCEGDHDPDDEEVDFDHWLDYNMEISDHAYRLAGKVRDEFYPSGVARNVQEACEYK